MIVALSFADAVVVSDVATAAIGFIIYDRVFADAVVVTDSFTRSVTYALSFADTVAVSDHTTASAGETYNQTFPDTVTVADAGVVEHHDYSAEDYFLTPFDYVGQRRTF
jgi:hypothetical protein